MNSCSLAFINQTESIFSSKKANHVSLYQNLYLQMSAILLRETKSAFYSSVHKPTYA